MATDSPSLAARVFGIDTRSLAALRIAVASLALIDLANRLTGFDALYTDAGVAPLALGRTLGRTFSLYGLDGSEAFALALAAAQAIACAMLLVGYRTRAASVASFALVASLELRNPFVNNGGDAFLRMLLFWCMFLPLGATASIDALRARRRGAPAGPFLACSPATAAVMLQLGILYFVAGVTKTGPEWVDGSALRIALDQRYWTREFAFVLASHPDGLVVGTYATRWLEIALPLLLFVPALASDRAGQRARIATVLGLWIFQAGLASTFVLNLFPWASTCGTLAFLPPRFWAWIRARTGPDAYDTPPLLARPPGALRAAGDAAVLVALAANLALAGATAVHASAPRWLDRAGGFLGFEQSWTMYAPSPIEFDLDVEVLGHFESGEIERLLGPVSSTRFRAPATRAPGAAGSPERAGWERVVALHDGHRLKVYLETGLRMGKRVEALRQGYLAWVCREWNRAAREGERIDAVAFVGLSRRTGVDGPEPPKTLQLSERSCAADPTDLSVGIAD
ncbi:MAG: HTTM domain-containing protein [Myxococcota bacterium]